MSAFGVEAAMHDIARDRELRTAFQADPDEVLAKKPLNAEERRIIRDIELGALLALGINPLLLLVFWMNIRGPETLPDFVVRVNACGGPDHG